MEYLKDPFDTGQTEDGFSTPYQSTDIEVHTLFLTLNTMEVAAIYLLNGILGRNFFNLHSSGSKTQVCSLPKQRGLTEISQQKWAYSQSLMVQKGTLTLM